MLLRGSIHSRAIAAAAGALALLLVGGQATQDAVANGDTRTLDIYRDQTKESASITFRRNGQYDSEALKQLNWIMRDWHTDEQLRMDPRLFDIVWQVYREVGSREPIHVVSGYRSPETNAALRRRSRAVAEFSQHMLGKAMDFYLTDTPMSRVREVGMRIQNGGVGFYPNAFNPFVHLDAGSVRAWPRMSGSELARLFPDGKTVHIPRHGKPLPGYEEAKAVILARGGSVAGVTTAETEEEAGPRKSLWAMLFGGGGEDEDTDYYRSASSKGAASARNAPPARSAAYAATREGDDAGTRGGIVLGRGRTQIASADPPPPGLERFGNAASATTPSADPPIVIPMPPRRPADVSAAKPLTIPAQVAAAEPSTIPWFPTLVSGPALPPPKALLVDGQAALRPSPVQAAPGTDDRAALRSLFAAVATLSKPLRPVSVATARPLLRPLDEIQAAWRDPASRVRVVFSSAPGQPGADCFSGPAVQPLPILR